MSDAPIPGERLARLLDEILELELARRDPEPPAERLAVLDRDSQELVLKLLRGVGAAHTELGYQVAMHAPHALALMEPDEVRAWVSQALVLYDGRGLTPALNAVREVERFARDVRHARDSVALDDVSGMLGHFLRGLPGRLLRVESGDEAWTDTDAVYLPPRIGRFKDPAANRDLYKALAVHHWAQTFFGTWRLAGEPQARATRAPLVVTEWLARREDPDRALARRRVVEGLRLDACLARELPGMHRLMGRLREQAGELLVPAEWARGTAALGHPDATLDDALRLAERLPEVELPVPCCYQGSLRPDAVATAAALRRVREQRSWQTLLWRWVNELRRERKVPTGEQRDSLQLAETPADGRLQIEVDGIPAAPPAELARLLGSVIQDFGSLSPDYLHPAGEGSYRSDAVAGLENGEAADDALGGDFVYDEWDSRRGDYRRDWCVLREVDAPPGDPAFYGETVARYQGHVSQLRRTFARLRGVDRRLRRQEFGDAIDFEALVEAYADRLSGLEIDDRLYTRVRRIDRSVAVLFMVDMSGSTDGWINRCERESLVLLCEALDKLGDRYAIYGFSGWTRKRCEIYPVKRFSDPCNDEVRARIAGMTARDYTRMGPVIRHLTGVLNDVDARALVLVTLSDGRPEDYDHYRGAYAIEDTRMALIEARRRGVHPYCITIDREGRDYLPRLYGPASYAVLDDVAKLPLKVADIYRRLAT